MTDEHNESVVAANESSQQNEEQTNEVSTTEVSQEQQNQTQEQESEEQLPPTRKTPQDYILERQVKKRKEAEERTRALEAELETLRGADAESGIEKEVSQHMLEHTRLLERKLEIKDFLAAHPAFAGYEAKMLKWSQDPAYARIPAKQLAYAIAGDDLNKMNPAAKEEAEREAASSRVLGGSVASNEPKQAKKVSEMSDKEFLMQVEKAKMGG